MDPMAPAARCWDIGMSYKSPTANNVIDGLSMDLGWYHDVSKAPMGDIDCAIDVVDMGAQQDFPGLNEEANFTSAVSLFTQLPLSSPEHGDHGDIETLSRTYAGPHTQRCPPSSTPSRFSPWSSSIEQALSMSATADTIATRRLIPTHTSIPTSTTRDASADTSTIESETTRRARYAANQRHSKARKARKDSHHADSISEADTHDQERKQRHREKNKVAAARCRSRQRKQVQTIQEKGRTLGEKNVELKAMIQELRGELIGLRSMALGHQQCSCHVAQYNLIQAERIAAEYR